jgi:hypothetical protein
VDVNNNGVYDSGEPIATADASGRYTISGLLQGGYVIREIRRDGWSRTTPPGDWPLGFIGVNLAPGQKSVGNNFGNVHAASALAAVSGIVFGDNNKNGRIDPGEGGFAGALVSLYSSPNSYSPLLTIYAGDNGYFEFDGLAPGTYFIAESDGYYSGRTGVTSKFTLLPGQSLLQNVADVYTGV